jgi:hypothetical protein
MPFSTYCYVRMPKSLKDSGPTFCRMMRAILKNQLQRNVFTYITNIVVASRRKAMQIDDLADTFANICSAQFKLNLGKCIFGVQKGNVLCCLVSMKGIKTNPDKINAIVHKKPP